MIRKINFDSLLSVFFRLFIYRSYQKKYKIGHLRFNGYFIRIAGDGYITAGANSYISYFSYVNVSEGYYLHIGNNVSIGHNVKIYTSSIDTKALIVEKVHKNVYGNIIIGDNVLIGSNVFICPNVNIGDNVVVGANSVITKDVPPNSVVCGSPAKIVRQYNEY